MICPSCGHDNLAGADTCEDCNSHLPDTPEVTQPSIVLKNRTLEDPINKAGARAPIVVEPTAKVSKVIKEMKDKLKR